MGWQGYHLHDFQVGDGVTFAAPDLDSDHAIDERKVTVKQILPRVGSTLVWQYDFGDSWYHTVTVEAMNEPDASARYPQCLDGARACPPEDCGGTHGYARLIEALTDPGDPEHDEMIRVGARGLRPRRVRRSGTRRRRAVHPLTSGRRRTHARRKLGNQELRGRRPLLGSGLVVGEGGLEPPRPFGHRNLNPARLPIPPLARVSPRTLPDAPSPAPTAWPAGTLDARWACRGSSVAWSVWSRACSRAPSGQGSARSSWAGAWSGRWTTTARSTCGAAPSCPTTSPSTVASDDHATSPRSSDPLVRELVDAAREHARDEDYAFLGPVRSSSSGDDELRPAASEITARMQGRAASAAASSSCPAATGSPSATARSASAACPECDITLADPNVSRRHAEVRPAGTGFLVVDLRLHQRHPGERRAGQRAGLRDGDADHRRERPRMRFEAS